MKLERLTDEEITRIVVKAVERVVASTSEIVVPLEDAGASAAINIDAPSSSPAIPSPSHASSHTPSSSQLVPSQPDSSSQGTPPALATPPFPSYPQLTPRILASLTSLSAGDARTALSLLELVLVSAPTTPEATLLASLRNSVSTSYDRTGDAHYDLISALHKSVRGSQPDAALYWLARMLGAGEDPLYIARRMTVCASEDIGLADNHALVLVRPPRFPHRSVL